MLDSLVEWANLFLENFKSLADSHRRLANAYEQIAEANTEMTAISSKQLALAEMLDKQRLAHSERIVVAQESLAQGIVPEKEDWSVGPDEDDEEEDEENDPISFPVSEDTSFNDGEEDVEG